MKTIATPNKMSMKNLMNGMLFGALVVMLMVASVGCDKSDSRNNNFQNCQNGFCRPGNPGFPGGPGFQPGFGNGVVGYGQDANTGSGVFLELVGQVAGNPYFMNGQVYIYGQIETPGIQCQFGGFVPGGIYSLESNFPGNAQNGIVYGAQLIAFGQNGIQLQITLNDARVELPINNTGFNNYDNLWANMTVQSVNGQPCNQLMTVYPW